MLPTFDPAHTQQNFSPWSAFNKTKGSSKKKHPGENKMYTMPGPNQAVNLRDKGDDTWAVKATQNPNT